MLAKLNKLDVVENLLVSGFTKRHQGHMLGLDSVFWKGEIYTCGDRESEAVIMQLLPFTVGIESLLCKSLIFNIEF